MPKIPSLPTSISQFTPSRLPEFAADDYPTFVAFLQAYYEWLETHGKILFTGRALASEPFTLTLPANASDQLNAYIGYSVVINDGPAAGQTRRIAGYDPIAKVITLVTPWTANVLPIHFSNFSVVDDNGPSKLLEYADIDSTVDGFLQYFKNEFLRQIPNNILADKRLVLKHIREFYKARGTEKSYRFLMRILFNEDVEFYYPKVDIFKPSDGQWYIEQIVRMTSTSNTFDWVNRVINGADSGTSAYVESVKQIQFGNLTVSELELSNIVGNFKVPDLPAPCEQVFIQEPTPPPSGSLEDPTTTYRVDRLYRIVTDINILESGDGYKVGDPVTVTGGGGYPAQAVVTAIYQVDYIGYAQDPPTSQDLEAYFEQRLAEDTEIQANIPGTLWGGNTWSDVFLDYNGFAISADQIILQADSSSVDDYYTGDAISLIQGSGSGQHCAIIAYDGYSKIATVSQPWVMWPDSSTKYDISASRGKIKKVQVTDFGVGFTSQPTVTFVSSTGSLAVGEAVLGALSKYPGRWLGTEGFCDNNKYIQDSYYYQDFSYVLKLGQSVDRYRDVVKALLHPAGTKLFGEVLVQTLTPQTILKAVEELIIYFDAQLYQLSLKSNSDPEIDVEVQAGTLGSVLSDIDRFKFEAFFPVPGVSLQSTFPNQNYWQKANTQIAHIANTRIVDFLAQNQPPFVFETYMTVRTDRDVGVVGPIGPTLRTLDWTKLDSTLVDITSPIFDVSGSDLPIEVFADMSIATMIGGGSTNIVPDTDVTITGSPLVPHTGNLGQYDCQVGQDPSVLYNISPSAFGEFGGVLEPVGVGGALPQWMNVGLLFKKSSVDLTSLAVSPTDQTVIVVTRARRLPSSLATLVSSTFSDNENGYSIEVGTGGTVNFRANSGGTPLVLSSPAKTIRQNGWFMAALRFTNGSLMGRVNLTDFSSKTILGFTPPSSNSNGWWLGKAADGYPGPTSTNSIMGRNRFGRSRFGQSATTGTPLSVATLDGDIAYLLVYDRAISDQELGSIYSFLKIDLGVRNISLP